MYWNTPWFERQTLIEKKAKEIRRPRVFDIFTRPKERLVAMDFASDSRAFLQSQSKKIPKKIRNSNDSNSYEYSRKNLRIVSKRFFTRVTDNGIPRYIINAENFKPHRLGVLRGYAFYSITSSVLLYFFFCLHIIFVRFVLRSAS